MKEVGENPLSGQGYIVAKHNVVKSSEYSSGRVGACYTKARALAQR